MDVVADTHQPTFKHINVDTVMGRPTRGRLMDHGEEEEEVVNGDEEEEEHVDEVLAVEWRFHRSATNCSKMSTDGAVMVALPDNYLFP